MNTETVLSLLTEKGYLVSRQRQIIIDALCRQRRITNVEAFWIAIREKHPVSWSTVYSTFKLLAQIGVLSPQPGSKRGHTYTLAMPGKHIV